jgi:hypothetical protein
MTRFSRKNRSDIHLKNCGGILDAIDDALNEIWGDILDAIDDALNEIWGDTLDAIDECTQRNLVY